MPRDNLAPAPAGADGGSPTASNSLDASDQISDAQFRWLIGSLCGLHQIAFDPALLHARCPGPHTADTLPAVLSQFGLQATAVRLDEIDPTAARISIAFLKPQSAALAVRPVIVTGFGTDDVTRFESSHAQPTALAREQFAASLAGPLLKITAIVAEPTDPDAVARRERFSFRWFVPELMKHKRMWRNALAASLVIQLLALGTPLFTQAIIDKVIIHRTESTLIALGIGLAVFLLFSSALTWVRQYLVLHTGMRIDAVLGASVFKHLVELPPRYFQLRPTGVIAARLHGVEQIREFLASAAASLVLDLPFLSVALALMFVYSVPLTLMALGFLAAIVGASLIAAPLFQTRLNREFLLGARNQAFVTEYVAGMDTVKSLQMEPQLAHRYGDYLGSYLQAGFATRQLGNTYQVIAQTLEQGLTVAILIVGAWIVMQPRSGAEAVFTIGMLVAFQMFAGKLSQPIMRLVGLWQQLQQARLAVKRLGDLMDVPPEPYSLKPTRAHKASVPGQTLIAIDRLAFRYAEDRSLLYEDLTFDIRAGECIAIRGPSGCGKSTLAKLLLGFYPPTRGAIRIDGIDTRQLAANELRATFGVVPQETVLFSGTVLQNLQLAHPSATFEDIVTACRMAEIHDVIEQLPQGYATELGERGAGLSGGQRQRLAIARALLKRPRVLLFDEATANLDQPTADSIAATINRLRGRVTILVITHAPLTGLQVDRTIDLTPHMNEACG
jgi:subfamily B ATP-binding cassette protein HlyB/CyaB